MRRGAPAFLLAAACALGGCARCAAPVSADAGSFREKNPTDVRTTLMTVLPEFRGAQVTAGQAELTRTFEWSAPAGRSLREALAAPMAGLGFVPSDANAEALAVRPPFTLHARQAGARLDVSVRLPLSADDVQRIYQSPAPLSSETMALILPAPPGARPILERFTLWVEYSAREERADFLVRQLVDMLVAGHWSTSKLPEGWEPERRPDGGVGGVPSKFQLTVTREGPPAEVLVERDGPRVRVAYTQPTWP